MGLTRAQLKRGYTAWKNATSSSQLCGIARRRGAAHARRVEGNVCDFWKGNSQHADERVPDLSILRRRVRRGMQSGRLALDANFDYRTLTTQHAIKCVKLIDKHFYGGQFQSLVDGWAFMCSVEPWEQVEDPGEGEIVAMAVVNRRARTYDIVIRAAGLYNLDEDVSQFEGNTGPRDRLTFLVVAVAHELAHVLAVAGGCQDRVQHSEGWDQINRYANGQVYSAHPIVDRVR